MTVLTVDFEMKRALRIKRDNIIVREHMFKNELPWEIREESKLLQAVSRQLALRGSKNGQTDKDKAFSVCFGVCLD